MSALWQGWQIFPELELNLKMEIGLINDFRWNKRGGFQHRAEMKHNARSNSWRRSSEGSASRGVGEQEGAGRSREEQHPWAPASHHQHRNDLEEVTEEEQALGMTP